jgi:hypothetical protein
MTAKEAQAVQDGIQRSGVSAVDRIAKYKKECAKLREAHPGQAEKFIFGKDASSEYVTALCALVDKYEKI